MNLNQERLQAILNSFVDYVIKEHGEAATLYILTAMGLTEEEILYLGLEEDYGEVRVYE